MSLVSNIKVLYEDNHIIVVVKEPNIPVQEDESNDLDMLTIIKKYLKEKYNKPGNVYLGLVHRLDRPVGGVMVFAKTSKAASRLSEQIRDKSINKSYVALVHGKTAKYEKLVNYLIKDDNTFTSSVTTSGNGKEAVMEYNLIRYIDDMSLLDINLLTGRHHQIRVQLSHIGHPIYGDQRYGFDEVGIQIHLWAYKLVFKHPVKDEVIEFVEMPSWYKNI